MPLPMQNPQIQQLMSNPQLFAQLLRQMGGQPPNIQGAGQVPFPGAAPTGGMPGGGAQPPQMGGQPGQPAMPGGQMPQQMAGGSPGMGQMPPGAPNMAPPGMPPMMQGTPQGGPPGPIPQGQFGGPQPPQMGGQPQMNPQMMQQIQQMMQQRQQQGMQGQQGMQTPGMQQGGNKFTPQELGALGRLGDTTIAHMTPGEISVPPQVQTPKVLATLNKEYHKKGVDPSQFTVGSPNSSINPNTGVPEYNFWSSILPMALGAAGGIFAGPLGAAAGAGVGNLAEGKDIGTSLLAAGLSGIGSYGMGQLLGGSGSVLDGLNSGSEAGAAGAAGDTTAASPVTSIGQDAYPGATGGANAGFLGGGSSVGGNVGPTAGNIGSAGGSSGAGSAGGGIFGNPNTVASLAPNPASLATMGNMSGNTPAPNNAGFLAGLMNNATTPANWGGVGGAAAGAGLGGMLGQANANPPQPSGFNTPYKNASQLPGWQTLMGKDTYKGPAANFTNYNPATNYPSAFNFFPQATNQTTS